MRGLFTSEGVCKNLEHYVSPDVEVQVILPLFVNSRTLERGDKLCYYKNKAEKEKEEQKAPEEVDGLRSWKKQRTATKTL